MDHVSYALNHPVFDPTTQLSTEFGWRVGYMSFMLTVNIGME